MYLHTERCKHFNRLATDYLKPWKSSKGFGSRSSQITTPGHKFARHIDNSIYNIILQLKTPKAFRHTLDDEDVDMDVAQECSHCDEYGYHDEEARQCRVKIDLMSLARPARAHKNKSEFGIHILVRLGVLITYYSAISRKSGLCFTIPGTSGRNTC